MAQTQVILLERVDNLGQMGDVVDVKPGYARNYLLPQKKALRASKENVAYFEAQKKHLESENEKTRKEAEANAKKLEGIKVPLIRAASESGQLFGSVNSRDIAEQASATSGFKTDRSMIVLNDNFKTIGLFPVEIRLHPEVKVEIIVNIARSSEEAQIQAETGRALVADAEESLNDVIAEAAEEDELEDVLEDSALQAKKEKDAKAAEDAADAAEKEAEQKAKAEAKAAKKAAKEAEATEAEEGEEEAPINEPEE